MTNTDIVLYGEDETPRQQKFIQQYFSADHLSNEEFFSFQIMQTTYTGGETVKIDSRLSMRLEDGREILQPIWLWGIFCYPKERVDTDSGEMLPKVGIIFRLGDKEGPSEIFLSFEAESANNFVKRSILPLIKRGMLVVGDWEMGIPIAVWAKPLPVGRTFRFRLLDPKELQ